MRDYVALITQLRSSERIHKLKATMVEEPRFVSMEQARIITRVYQENPNEPKHIKRAKALAVALQEITIQIDPLELIVGNRTAGVRSGVVFPEAGISWIDKELDTLDSRPQDKFFVHQEDKAYFRDKLLPYWKGETLEDIIKQEIGSEVSSMSSVVKINQKDHAQGHICPDTKTWLTLGPAGLLQEAENGAARTGDPNRFYEGVIITLQGAINFIHRYAELAEEQQMPEVAAICYHLMHKPAETFHQAVQSLWFLFTILHMESNASSFSPGRMDQYLYPYFRRDMETGALTYHTALELIEALWLKFNQIVYLRNSESAKYFAGFPIGFNVAIGGQGECGCDYDGGRAEQNQCRQADAYGQDASNELSFFFLQAQAHLGLPQPNLSARLHKQSPKDLVDRCAEVIGLGSGMPQIFNDETVIPSLQQVGISQEDATNYAIVGCVELTTQGNSLGWSDAAMFNMVKALELTLTGGIDLLSGKQVGLNLGNLASYKSFEALESAYAKQLEHFIEKMIPACHVVDRLHGEILPSPFLSSVITPCLEKGIDVTNGGAKYNLSGIQAIQPANIADSLAAIKQLVFDQKVVDAKDLLTALYDNFDGWDVLRARLQNKVPKYGNDVEWVDMLGAKWVQFFATALQGYTNRRGGSYHAGLYTVSAHVPMGKHVGATTDGRYAEEPLADGGMSAVYGRDMQGPSALLQSVSRIDSRLGSNGTLLNMKFSPQLFRTAQGIEKFSALLRAFVQLNISHVQFNVLTEDDLQAAIEDPESYKSLTVRVAGYTAYFTELAPDLQREIIARTTYTDFV